MSLEVKTAKDLGVYFNNKLKSGKYALMVTNGANLWHRTVKRTFQNLI